jgi:hypothetical protein
MSWIWAAWRAIYYFRTWNRWQGGIVPSLADRRYLIRLVEKAPRELLAASEHVYGPGVISAIIDKCHRRRMAVWNAGKA